MFNFNFVERIIPSVHHPINQYIYLFPINGMDMSVIKELKIGYVTFIDKEVVKIKYYNENFVYNVGCYALVDLSSQTFILKYDNGLNSVALKILKETIGFINISLYSRLSPYKERKITISNINKHLVEEGLISYLSVSNDGTIKIENARFVTANMTMTTSEFRVLMHMNANWTRLLEEKFEERSELHKKILKGLEYIYYISNEIYASERIIKYFIVLNNIFRVDNLDLNRKGIAMYLNLVFSRVRVVQIFEGKFNKEFEKLYEEIRNKIMHGILNLDNEEGLIDSADFYYLKTLFFELMIALTENKDIFSLTSTKDLNNYLLSLI